MSRRVLAMVVVVTGCCGIARAADDGGYEEFMRAPAMTTTVKSLCVAIMSSPYQGNTIELRPCDAVFSMNFTPPVPGGAEADPADRPDGA